MNKIKLSRVEPSGINQYKTEKCSVMCWYGKEHNHENELEEEKRGKKWGREEVK